MISRKARVSLCMIVRDEEQNLADCLRPVAELFDEIVIVDTGSRDATRQVARQFTDRVVEFTWCDDFSAARNESLRHATGDWIFWLDADDRIDAANRERLQRLFATLPDERVAYVMRCLCGHGPGQTSSAFDHVRLFRRHPEARWKY